MRQLVTIKRRMIQIIPLFFLFEVFHAAPVDEDEIGGARLAELKLQVEKPGHPPVLEGYKEGPHPLISDSLFSLIIFIYVMVTFLYMFYGFCWKEPEKAPPPPPADPEAE